MLWNHAYGRPTEPRDTTNALPIFNYGEMLEEIWKEQADDSGAARASSCGA
jgi:hypothetical protein